MYSNGPTLRTTSRIFTPAGPPVPTPGVTFLDDVAYGKSLPVAWAATSWHPLAVRQFASLMRGPLPLGGRIGVRHNLGLTRRAAGAKVGTGGPVMPTDDVFTQRAARAAQLKKDLIQYEKALETVRAFEEKYPEFAADRRGSAPPVPEQAAETQAEPSTSLKTEDLKGSNMQETVYNAALTIPPGTEFEPGHIIEILEAKAPMAMAVYEIDEKKARDALGRLAKAGDRGIERTRSGTRGRHGSQPAFRRLFRPDGDEAPVGTGASRDRGAATDLTIAEFAERALEVAGPPPRSTQELIAGMEKLGWSTEAKDPYSTVFGTLRRELGNQGSRLEKHDGKWCLKGWVDEPAAEEVGEARPEAINLVRNLVVSGHGSRRA